MKLKIRQAFEIAIIALIGISLCANIFFAVNKLQGAYLVFLSLLLLEIVLALFYVFTSKNINERLIQIGFFIGSIGYIFIIQHWPLSFMYYFTSLGMVALVYFCLYPPNEPSKNLKAKLNQIAIPILFLAVIPFSNKHIPELLNSIITFFCFMILLHYLYFKRKHSLEFQFNNNIKFIAVITGISTFKILVDIIFGI